MQNIWFAPYTLPCGCRPSPPRKPCCAAPRPVCPSHTIPPQGAPCGNEDVCEAETAAAALHLCAVAQAKMGWTPKAKATQQTGVGLALGAAILAGACHCHPVAKALRKLRRLAETNACGGVGHVGHSSNGNTMAGTSQRPTNGGGGVYTGNPK